MEGKPLLLLLLALLSAAAAQWDGGPQQQLPQWRAIPEPGKNGTMLALGGFAVQQFNATTNSSLQFATVLEAAELLVDGTAYRLAILALDAPFQRVYRADLFRELETNWTHVNDFRPVLAEM